MFQRPIGTRTVGAIGLGAMPMSLENRPDEARSLATIHAAIDAGVTLIDTADAYHVDPDEVGHNEELVARALKRSKVDTSTVLVATKGGHLRPGDGSWTQNGRPEYLKAAAKASAQRLGVDAIGLYQLHRPDPAVPYAESIGALNELLDEGVVQLVGISNVSVAQIDEANQVLRGRLTSVQNQFSPSYRASLPELKHCEALGVAFLPYSPLGNIRNAARLADRHPTFDTVARAHAVSPYQVALAWELALSPVVIPIPGASRPTSVQDSTRAVDLKLSPEEIVLLSASPE